MRLLFPALKVINKCLTGKSSGYDSLWLSQALILWGLYHKRNIDYAFLIWEDFVYQVEHKNHKKSNEMYYPRFTKVIIHHFMSKDPSIPRRNKVNWHYVRDDFMFLTIKAYKEYYAFATGEAAPKPKASARRTRSGSDTSITLPTAAATPKPTAATTPRLTAATKGKQPAKAPKAKSLFALSKVAMTEAEQLKLVLKRSREQMHISQPGGSGTDKGTGSKPGVPDVSTDESEEELSWNSSDDEGVDDQGKDRDDDEDQEVAKIDEQDDAEGGGDDDEESENDEEDDDKETRDEKIFNPIPITPKSSKDDGNDEEDQGLKTGKEERLNEEEEAYELYRDVDINQGRDIQLSQENEDSYVTLTPINPDDVESIFATASTSIDPLPTPTPTMTLSIIVSTTTASQAPIPPMTFPSDIIQHLPSFGSLFCFDDRLKALEANFSEFSQTNPFAEAVFAIPEMELKKILIEKMEGNKSIQRSDEQRNLYKALVEAYEADKIILDTYEENRGSKRRREGKEPESASALLETATRSTGRSTTGSRSRQASASKSAFAEEPVQTTSQMDEPSHPPQKPPTPDRDWNKTLLAVQGSTQTWISELAKQANSRSSFNELLDTTLDFSNFIMNRLRVDTLTLELLAGPTYELMKGSCRSLIELEYHLEEVYKATTNQSDWVNPEGQQYPHNLLQPLPLISNNRGRCVIPFAHFINNDLEYLQGGASSRKYTTSVTKTKAADYGHIKWIEDLVPRTIWIQEPIDYDKHALWGVSHCGRKRQKFYGFTVNWESTRDVYSKRRIIAVTDLKIVEWHSYKYLDWITVRRDDNKLYKFKEEDLQLGVESYQKRLNLTKPDTYRSDLKRREAYTAYSNPRGFIYKNKDKKNRFMRIDELYKFSDRTLNDVRTALDDRLKRIRMRYLP
nr:hypothetical protein [Tanacetum cinerariifolium]